LPQGPMYVAAQLVIGVELACGAGELVVGGRQDLLLDLLDRELRRPRGAVGQCVLDGPRVAGRRTQQRALDFLEQPVRAELEHQRALRLTRLLDRVDDDYVTRLSRATLDGRQARH